MVRLREDGGAVDDMGIDEHEGVGGETGGTRSQAVPMQRRTEKAPETEAMSALPMSVSIRPSLSRMMGRRGWVEKVERNHPDAGEVVVAEVEGLPWRTVMKSSSAAAIGRSGTCRGAPAGSPATACR